MRINPKDGVCRECGGVLRIVGADDATLEVECTRCGDGYSVEPDAFHDGGVIYWPAAMAELEEERETDADSTLCGDVDEGLDHDA
jgi:hypothetical protein